MKQKEIEKELNKIYKKMNRWRAVNKNLNYAIPQEEVKKREDIFYLQQTLYKIEDAKKEGDENKEYFHLALYYLTKTTMTSLQNEKNL